MKGQPADEYRYIFMSYLAVAVRQRCSIGIQNWRNVPSARKQVLWDDICITFIMPKTKRKWVEKHRGERLRTFRSYLKEAKLLKSNGMVRLQKPHRYNYITQYDWDEFVKYHTSSEFLHSVRKTRPIVRKINTSIICLVVDMLWKKARTSTSGECSNAEVQTPVARMDAMELSGRIDPWRIIVEAMGTEEHPRRKQGVGLEMTKTDMKLPRKPRKKDAIDTRFEAMAAVILNPKQQVEVLRGGSAPLPNPNEVPIIDSAQDSCTTDPRISSLPGGQHKCDLLAMYPTGFSMGPGVDSCKYYYLGDDAWSTLGGKSKEGNG